MVDDRPNLARLVCGVRHYDWGERPAMGRKPYIAELLDIVPEPEQPFAELWIGTHPELPATALIGQDEIPLSQLLAQRPEAMFGPDATTYGRNGMLPFLLKVLSCEKPLSIQSHPDRALARRIHRESPDNYPDDNHKPEVAIAISEVEALCQFRTASDIRADVSRLPVLAELLNVEANGMPDGHWLRRAYARCFAPGAADATEKLCGYMRSYGTQKSFPENLFLQLNAHCPGDPGALSAFFLNYVRLQPGQALFIAPNEPHAYLHGTMVECMANSDNVVRAGLTAKFVDRELLLRTLTYRQGPPEILVPQEQGPAGLTVFPVPVNDFGIGVLHCPPARELTLESGATFSILLVTQGPVDIGIPNSPPVRANTGSVWAWPACLERLQLRTACHEAEVFRAWIPRKSD